MVRGRAVLSAIVLASTAHAATAELRLVEPADAAEPPLATTASPAAGLAAVRAATLSLALTVHIPNATWRAIGATVSQSDNLIAFPNALVWELDHLIDATCPGASFCPTDKSTQPFLGDILGSEANDAIVTIASQTDSAKRPVRLMDLAHTTPADGGALVNWSLSYANVLNSTTVNSQVSAWLANSAAPTVTPTPVDSTAQPPLPWPGFDYNRELADDSSRLPQNLPYPLAMGTPIALHLDMAPQQIGKVFIFERNEFDSPLGQLEARVEPAPDGGSIVTVAPLLLGRGVIRVRANFRDYVVADRSYLVDVAPPAAAPLGFWADYPGNHQEAGPARIRLKLGDGLRGDFGLQPYVAFAAAPDRLIWLKRGVAFRVLDNGAAPAVSVDAKGFVTALRPGSSTIEARLGQFTATIEAVVEGR